MPRIRQLRPSSKSRLLLYRVALLATLILTPAIAAGQAPITEQQHDEADIVDSYIAPGGEKVDIGDLYVLQMTADGEPIVVRVAADEWDRRLTVDERSPLFRYVAAFATFFIAAGAGIRAVDYWKEIH